jgi:hypothetical protein
MKTEKAGLSGSHTWQFSNEQAVKTFLVFSAEPRERCAIAVSGGFREIRVIR